MKVKIEIDSDAIDSRGREPALAVADILSDLASWFRASAPLRPCDPRPIRNTRPGVQPETCGLVFVVKE